MSYHDERADEARGEIADWLAENEPEWGGPPDESCGLCGGELTLLGALGARLHYRCRNCGWETSNYGRHYD